MLRESSLIHEQDWSEKTLSILREKQFEACERRLSNTLQFSLFSPLATNTYAQQLFEQSYFADEVSGDRLITVEALRAKVLKLLPHEAHYLSSAENALLEQLLLAGGRPDIQKLGGNPCRRSAAKQAVVFFPIRRRELDAGFSAGIARTADQVLHPGKALQCTHPYLPLRRNHPRPFIHHRFFAFPAAARDVQAGCAEIQGRLGGRHRGPLHEGEL